ncbi:hypothetical protein PVAP13_1KG264805 [Panicum virgatum]|uniref:Uncharacterized protein n=1 Tax=Panicum virgatum TaxID=38727 RepID=A0A8T0XK80_PANVG|nr:hypothetical protein PVAP13_1KG264805 [Panicum virgatum]
MQKIPCILSSFICRSSSSLSPLSQSATLLLPPAATPAPTSRAPPPHHLPYSHAAAGQPPREAGAGALPAPSLLPASARSRPTSRAETASHRGPPPMARPPPSAGSHARLPRGEAAARAEVVTSLLLLLPLLALAARADDDGGGDSEAAAVLPAEAGAGVWRAHPTPAAAEVAARSPQRSPRAPTRRLCGSSEPRLHPLQAPLVVGHERRRRC